MKSSAWVQEPLSSVVIPAARAEIPVPGTVYRQIGVKLWGEGAYERQAMDGSATKYARLFRAEAGDIIVNKIWARNGSVAVVPASLAGCYGSGEFPMFTPDRTRLDPQWAHWLTKTPAFWEQCDLKSRGTSGKNRIRPDRFLEIVVPLPPLPEQQRIVARIEALANRVQQGLALRQDADETTRALIASATSRLCSSATWPTTPVGALASGSFRNGKSVKSSDGESGIRCLTLSAVRAGRIDTQNAKPVPLTLAEAKPFLVRHHDVFIVRGNGSKSLCGLAGLVTEAAPDLIFPDLFIRVDLPPDRMLPAFFVIVWNAPATREVLEDKAKTTSGIWKINQGHIASTVVPIPPLAEQTRILGELDSLRVEMERVQQLQTETAVELDALLPAILDRAFKGEL